MPGPSRHPTRRILIVPAAGPGSRLQSTLPKWLVPVNGRPMLDWLLDLYRTHVDRLVVIVHPSAEPQARAYGGKTGASIDCEVQASPTGMLDAILLAHDRVRRSEAQRVWITWCDQIALHPRTVANLARLSDEHPDAALILPTAVRADPYIHLDRDRSGRIVRVLHRRERDAMPSRGESDVGVFSLSRRAYLDDLPLFAAGAATGGSTGERNFLPFIPWIAQRTHVITFPCIDDMEAVGVNTPVELTAVSEYLASRAGVS